MEQQLFEYLREFRRDLHRNPELGYKEFRTTKKIADELQLLQIPFECGPANMKTGVVATLKKGEGRTILLRADIDALPMTETSGVGFASQTEQVMHACGHDVHTTMLIGAAHLLQAADFQGTVKFVFQPSEEGVYDDPERKSGGQRIAESNVLDDVYAAVGLHVHPLVPVGQITFAPGNALACASFFAVEVTGRSGHAGAAPHLSIDPVLIASHIIQAAQSVISRNISPTEAGVLSITKIQGGTAENVIADKVVMKGTIRALDISVYEKIVSRFQTILDGIAQAFETRISLEFFTYYPSLWNDMNVHKALLQPLEHVYGRANIIEVPPLLGGEDFAFYSRKVPSMFYFIGARDTAETAYFVHHPSVIVNEDCIPPGANFLAQSALELMTH